MRLFIKFLVLLCFDLLEGFSSTGCYSQEPQNRDDMSTLAYQQASGLAVINCCTKCQEIGKPYSGLLKGSFCYCGDEFGRTSPVKDCNFTCVDGFLCGGLASYSNYYVIDESKDKERNLIVLTNKKNYSDARKTCIKMNGDLVGRFIKDNKELLVSMAKNSSANTQAIWIGLRKRDTDYEWIDEKEPTQADTYVKQKYVFSNQWTPTDSGRNCVSLDLSTKMLLSQDCSETLNFICSSFALTTETDETTSVSSSLTKDSGNTEESSKTLALFIVLPLFFICYGGACILYCVHQTIRHCCGKEKFFKRPSSVKKSTISPAGLLDPMPCTLSPLMSYSTKSPYVAETNSVDVKKAKLLENAASEARERRQKESEVGKIATVFSGQNKETFAKSSLGDDNISSKLLPPPLAGKNDPLADDAKTAQQSMAGMSINEILRLKMAQQANKKHFKKILAA